MKKTKKTSKPKSSVSDAVRALRAALDESQQSFAYRMKTAIRTIARYETVRPPKGKALAELYRVAEETGNAELADIFRDALTAEIGVAGKFTELGALASHTIPGIHASLAVLLNHLEYGSASPENKIAEAIQQLKTVISEMDKLNLFLPQPTDDKETN
jgi:transcriptional regulator with XRE-family HTH domain